MFPKCLHILLQHLSSQSISNALFSSCLYEALFLKNVLCSLIGWLDQCVVIGQEV